MLAMDALGGNRIGMDQTTPGLIGAVGGEVSGTINLVWTECINA
jgi:hypothetical protein